MAALFSLRPHSFLLRKKRIAAASEEASSIPLPPGRRKLHIRSLLLPSQIVTVSLGHNLAIWNFTTPHAILMMADRRNFVDTVCRGGRPCPPGALHIRNAKPFGEIVLPYGPTESSAPTRCSGKRMGARMLLLFCPVESTLDGAMPAMEARVARFCVELRLECKPAP